MTYCNTMTEAFNAAKTCSVMDQTTYVVLKKDNLYLVTSLDEVDPDRDEVIQSRPYFVVMYYDTGGEQRTYRMNDKMRVPFVVEP